MSPVYDTIAQNFQRLEGFLEGSEIKHRGSSSVTDTLSGDDFSKISTPVTSFSSEMINSTDSLGYVSPNHVFYQDISPIEANACPNIIWTTSDPFYASPDSIINATPPESAEANAEGAETTAASFSSFENQEINICLPESVLHLQQQSVDARNHDGLVSWYGQETGLPLTVIPSETFQNTYHESPPYMISPSTPNRPRGSEQGTPRAWNSPYTFHSPGTEMEIDVKPNIRRDIAYGRVGSSRLRRQTKPYQRAPKVVCNAKGTSSRPCSKRVKKKSNTDNVIEANRHQCSVGDCKGRFKRKEHLKRHETTVHVPPGPKQSKWKCVFCATGLSRSDNLKQHLKQTHGVNKSGKRSKYVATCDVNSDWYWPEYRGLIDTDGCPTLDESKDKLADETRADRRKHTQEEGIPCPRSKFRGRLLSKL
ncbi:MAG: hypothetical protein Q9227_003906 [Pyrenula ochraceoflavens]